MNITTLCILSSNLGSANGREATVNTKERKFVLPFFWHVNLARLVGSIHQPGVVACVKAHRGSVGGPPFPDLSSHTLCRIIRSNTKPLLVVSAP